MAERVCDRFKIETVEKCIEEALTGNQLNPKYIHVDRKKLLEGLSAHHQVSKKDIAKLVLSRPECQTLDDGELHLFAWLNSHESLPDALILISTADKATIVSTEESSSDRFKRPHSYWQRGIALPRSMIFSVSYHNISSEAHNKMKSIWGLNWGPRTILQYNKIE